MGQGPAHSSGGGRLPHALHTRPWPPRGSGLLGAASEGRADPRAARVGVPPRCPGSAPRSEARSSQLRARAAHARGLQDAEREPGTHRRAGSSPAGRGHRGGHACSCGTSDLHGAPRFRPWSRGPRTRCARTGSGLQVPRARSRLGSGPDPGDSARATARPRGSPTRAAAPAVRAGGLLRRAGCAERRGRDTGEASENRGGPDLAPAPRTDAAAQRRTLGHTGAVRPGRGSPGARGGRLPWEPLPRTRPPAPPLTCARSLPPRRAPPPPPPAVRTHARTRTLPAAARRHTHLRAQLRGRPPSEAGRPRRAGGRAVGGGGPGAGPRG